MYMARIRTKKDSINYIKKNNLNYFGESIFKRGDLEKVNKFLNKYDVKYYYMRELIPSTPNVFYNLTKEEVITKINDFSSFGLAVSSLNIIEHQVLCGEIIIGSDDKFTFSGSTNNESTHRNFLEPTYFLDTDIFDERIKFIPHIDEIIDYIYNHNLFDKTIEFCIFDEPTGTKQETVVIYEIRTDY